MGLKITQVDAFTDRAFFGNPAAVCVLPEPKSDEWMQLVAREMNLSETAFLLKEGEGFRLRWFSPNSEVQLCGHATLASSHVLWEEGILQPDRAAIFHTMSGKLLAKYSDGWIELDFPLLRPESSPASADLLRVLEGTQVNYTGKSKPAWLVELDSEESVRAFSPDIPAIKKLDLDLIITARASNDRDYDFVSRYFAPLYGIDEDPVTGSAHCVLGPYWAEKLQKPELRAYQASKRGGFLRVRVSGDRTFLVGRAVTVFRGELI